MNATIFPSAPLPLRRSTDERVTRWVSFELGEQRYALRIEQVREVLSHAEIEPVPGASPSILGVTNLRGRIVTVIDVHFELGLRRATGGSSCIVVVEHDGEPVALRVDRISELYAVADSVIKPPPAVARNGSHRAVCGVLSRPELIVTLLDVGGLLHDG